MNILALLIAVAFSYLTGTLASTWLEDKLDGFDKKFGRFIEHYPNTKDWEYLYVDLLSAGLGLFEFLLLCFLFVGDSTLSSLIVEVITATALGFVLAVFISEICFSMVIDGTRKALKQRKKCLEAIARRKTA